MSGWQHIASAPRDGTRVIVGKWAWVYSSLATIEEPVGDAWHLCFATTAHFDPERGKWTDGLDWLVDPTHFIHLPDAPTTPSTEGQGA